MQQQTISVGNMAGFAAASAKEGDQVQVLQRGRFTASDPRFYVYINQIEDEFLAPADIRGDSITNFLVVINKDFGATIYTNLSIVVEAEATRAIEAGDPVAVDDIRDIRHCRVEGVELQSDDAVICVLKIGWKYGLYFDFTRSTSEEEVWLRLGELSNSLHTDRIIENIQRQILESEKPHVITEGKTDWRHIEAARRKLEPLLLLGYPTSDDSLGDEGLLQLCERLAKFGPPNRNQIIAVFDRDNPKVLRKLEQKGDLRTYQSWGNNVYSFALPAPTHRRQYKNVSIEMLYTDQDLALNDENGKRLFFDKELEIRKSPSGGTYCVPVPLDGTLEYDKKVADELASRIVDEHGRHLGLSKARFAELVHAETADFSRMDFAGFAGVFEIINMILAEPNKSDAL